MYQGFTTDDNDAINKLPKSLWFQIWLQFLYKISFLFGVINSIFRLSVIPVLHFLEEVICIILSFISFLYN